MIKIIIKLKNKHKKIDLSDQETHWFTGLTSEPAGSHQFSLGQLQIWFDDFIEPSYPPIHCITGLTCKNGPSFKTLDSKLVVKQLTKKYKCIKEKLLIYFVKDNLLLRRFNIVHIKHVPQLEN